MPFGYIGQNQTKQQVKNSGVLSSFDISLLEKKGQAGDSLELIKEYNSTDVSSIIFDAIKEDVYDVHFMTLTNISVSTHNNQVRIRLYENGVEETAGVYQFGYQYADGGQTGNFGESKTTTYTHFRANYSLTTSSNIVANSYQYFHNLGDANKYSTQNMQVTGMSTDSSTYRTVFGGGVLPQTSKVDGIKCYVEAGTFSAVTKLYGVKKL